MTPLTLFIDYCCVKGWAQRGCKFYLTLTDAQWLEQHFDGPSQSSSKRQREDSTSPDDASAPKMLQVDTTPTPGGSSVSDTSSGLKATETKQSTKGSYYAVARGKQTGIFRSWPEVQPLIKGVSSPDQRRFDYEHEAMAYLKEKGQEIAEPKTSSSRSKRVCSTQSSPAAAEDHVRSANLSIAVKVLIEQGNQAAGLVAAEELFTNIRDILRTEPGLFDLEHDTDKLDAVKAVLAKQCEAGLAAQTGLELATAEIDVMQARVQELEARADALEKTLVMDEKMRDALWNSVMARDRPKAD